MNVWQGFGKAKNRVGMARPKKTKVAAREEAQEAMTSSTTAEIDENQATQNVQVPTAAASPGKVNREEAGEELEELHMPYRVRARWLTSPYGEGSRTHAVWPTMPVRCTMNHAYRASHRACQA